MSEFSQTAAIRINKLSKYIKGLIDGKDGIKLIEEYDIKTENFIPHDILETFDNIFKLEKDIEKIKIASNKLFNILYQTFNNYPAFELKKNSFLYYIKEDNKVINKILSDIRPEIKKINKEKVTDNNIGTIRDLFIELQKIDTHYTLKENILFPVLEKNWEHYDCLKLMWSFHDDIRKNIKKIIELLKLENFDLIKFNKISAQIFFNISTIIFREEKILFPVILQSISNDELNEMLVNSKEIGFSFIDTSNIKVKSKSIDKSGLIKFDTGEISVKEAELIFNHLPVDLTFVDADDTVKYFSTPKHRIFPRTNAIIGRKVHDCHPPESVHVVEKIVDAFKNGEKDKAAFWIKMGKQFILIQYFAVRDNNGKFIGTLEVSQEVSEIRNLTGEKRLLDWEN